MPEASGSSFPVLLSSRRFFPLRRPILNQLDVNPSGCTRLAIFDLKQAEMDVAIKDLSDSALENGIGPNELELIGVECDVASEESVKNAFDQITKRFGRVDAVVASAGTVVICIMTPREFNIRSSKGIVENYSALEYARKSFFPFNGGFIVNSISDIPSIVLGNSSISTFMASTLPRVKLLRS